MTRLVILLYLTLNLTLHLQVTKAKKDHRPVSAQPDVITPDVYAAIQKSESRQAQQLRDILSRPTFKVSSITIISSYMQGIINE